MVKKISIFLAYFLFFIITLMYFTPKNSIYYLAEHKLKDYGVILSNENLKESGLSLYINKANLSVKSIESAYIDKTKISLFVIYNSVYIKGITLSNLASNFIPVHIDNIDIKYTVLNPIKIIAKAKGDFGRANIFVNLLKKVVKVHLYPSKSMLRNYHSTLNNFKKDKNGGLVYEQSF